MKIFYTVNEGLFLLDEAGGHGLLVDGIHHGVTLGFSDTPESLLHYMTDNRSIRSHVDALLFTHPHEDHYAPDLIPEIYRDRVVLAWEEAGAVQEAEAISRRSQDRLEIRLFRTRHEGEAYRNVPHMSLLVRMGEKRVFLPADADLDSVTEYLTDIGRADYVFFNPYQVLSPHCADCLRSLQPERLFLYHRPAEIQPGSLYDSLSAMAVKKYSSYHPILERPEPMTWIM